jgi:hypothetical protein
MLLSSLRGVASALLLAAVLLLAAAPHASNAAPDDALAGGVYFHVQEGVQKCFVEEVPENVLVLGQYKNLDYTTLISQAGNERSGLFATIKDPHGAVMTSHDLVEEGRFAFTSQTGGEHQVCLLTNTTAWFGVQRNFRLLMTFEVGENARDYSLIAKQEHLSAIEVEIRKLNDKIVSVRAEQSYQREREEEFRDMSEDTNSRVMWWNVIQTLVLVCSGVWQISKLKVFFKAKKLA